MSETLFFISKSHLYSISLTIFKRRYVLLFSSLSGCEVRGSRGIRAYLTIGLAN